MMDKIICIKCKHKVFKSQSYELDIINYDNCSEEDFGFRLCADCYSKLEPVIKKFVGWVERQD